MVGNQKQNQQQAVVQPSNMYLWRIQRMEAGKHQENVNRDIMRRQFVH